MTKQLTWAVHVLLKEAQLRYAKFGLGEPLLEAWTGLGHLTTYKSVLNAGLMEWVDEPPPFRCMGWLRLTAAGAEIVQGWLDKENEV